MRAPFRALAVAALAATLFAPVLLLSSPSSATDRTVFIRSGNRFVDQDKYIQIGDTVRWVYDDAEGGQHTVESTSSEPFDSSTNCPSRNPLVADDCLDEPGQTFTHTFNNPGNFPYRCERHYQLGMVGTIHVTNAPPPTTPPPSTKPPRSPSPSVSGSPNPSPSISPSPGTSPSPGPTGDEPSSSNGAGAKIAIALLGMGVLGGAGYWIYRRFISGT